MKDGRINHYKEAHRGDGPQFICYSKEVEPSQAGPEWTGDWESEACRLKEELEAKQAGLAAMEERYRLAEAGAAATREMIQSMILAKGAKYSEDEIPPASHAERNHVPCLLCLKRIQMLIHNSVIENMEASIAADIGATTLARIERMEHVLKATIDTLEACLQDDPNSEAWRDSHGDIDGCLTRLKEVPHGS